MFSLPSVCRRLTRVLSANVLKSAKGRRKEPSKKNVRGVLYETRPTASVRTEPRGERSSLSIPNKLVAHMLLRDSCSYLLSSLHLHTVAYATGVDAPGRVESGSLADVAMRGVDGTVIEANTMC